MDKGIDDGDVIEITDAPGHGYRNNGKMIWYQKKAHLLAFYPDDYGNLPEFVEISDTNSFTPYYWFKDFAIDHNNFVWFSQQVRRRLKFKKTDKGFLAKTEIKGVEYKFWFQSDSLTSKAIKDLVVQGKCIYGAMDDNYNIRVVN
jgi:hypothetical protein